MKVLYQNGDDWAANDFPEKLHDLISWGCFVSNWKTSICSFIWDLTLEGIGIGRNVSGCTSSKANPVACACWNKLSSVDFARHTKPHKNLLWNGVDDLSKKYLTVSNSGWMYNGQHTTSAPISTSTPDDICCSNAWMLSWSPHRRMDTVHYLESAHQGIASAGGRWKYIHYYIDHLCQRFSPINPIRLRCHPSDKLCRYFKNNVSPLQQIDDRLLHVRKVRSD